MIDTIRFHIPITPKIHTLLEQQSHEYTKKNKSTGNLDYVYHKNEITVGSFNRDLNFTLKDTSVDIELSLPKYWYGHNVLLLYPSQIPEVIKELYDEFVIYFGDFTYYDQWRITRIDICYAWKFEDQLQADRALSILRLLSYPQKKTMQHETGVSFSGRYLTLKAYLKQPEFRKNDYPKLHKKNMDDFAREVFDLANGVLRFEVGLREEVFNTYFGDIRLHVKDVCNDDLITKLLNTFMQTLFRYSDRIGMTFEEAYEKLKSKYSPRWSEKLYNFWKLKHSLNPTDKKAFNETYSKDRRLRYNKKLKSAGVGPPKNDTQPSFDFAIPNHLCVNTVTGHVAVATDQN
jgi:II/X family phage/plasmid replication protein